jgi:ABC-type transporter Mla subunit MlaD
MDISDGQLLRELKRALDAVSAEGPDAQAAALEATLRRYNATMADVTRALGAVRDRRRRELARLAGGIGAIAERQSDAAETAEAVDTFLRGLSGGGRS